MLQLLDLARENAALKRELDRLQGERAALEHVLCKILRILADTASSLEHRRPDRRG